LGTALQQIGLLVDNYCEPSGAIFMGGNMKKMTSLLMWAALAAMAMPAGASGKMVKQCKDLGISEIKNCASCHTDKKPSKTDMNEVGAWLVAQKEARKAAEFDMAWLKEYFADKK
jgi:cytochrome c553